MSDYTIAKYIRLSIEDEKTESMSIPHQRLLLDRHIDSLDIPNTTICEFVDNGHSGVNMERPAVQELIDLVRSGRVNMIVVKDFSRFSRSSMDSEYFISQVFPLYQVRFISVSDNFDSNDYKNDTGGIDIAFKFLMHEFYSKDLSQKVKSAKRVKMVRGENVVANALYGYRKNADKKWEPEPETAPIVRQVYAFALQGMTPATIRDKLCEMKVLTPQEWIDTKRGKDIVPAYRWNTPTITRMLTNEQYIGTYIAGKSESKAVGSHNSVSVDESEWIKIPNSHPPLIGKEDFDKVRELMAKYLKSRTNTLAVEQPVFGESKRPHRRVLMERGELMAAAPLYGYGNLPKGEREISPTTAAVVREVFDLALQGKTPNEISALLTKKGCPTPREQINLDKGKDITLGKAWTRTAITSILRNEQYTGMRIAGKTRSCFDGTATMYRQPESEWIKFPNRHPTIVSAEDFAAVQVILDERLRGKRKTTPLNYLLKGKVKCGCCGLALAYDSGTNDPVYRCCHTHADPNAECHKMKVFARELDEAVLAIIQKQAEVVLNEAKLSVLTAKGTDAQRISDFEKQLAECMEQRQNCYERFIMREIDRDEYNTLKTACTAQIDKLGNQIAVIKQTERDIQSVRKSVAIAKHATEKSATSQELVNTLIEKIFVRPGNELEIIWKIADFSAAH